MGCIEVLAYAKDYLLKNFGTTRVTLGEYQRLERGEKSLPLPGLPDVLTTMYSVAHREWQGERDAG